MTKHGKERIFDSKMKQACWDKHLPVLGRDPERWRYDAVGNVVCRRLTSCIGCLCHEYDHILPFSKGGETTVENCQILQSRVNRYKGNKEDLSYWDLRSYSCNAKFGEKELDAVELAVYGNVKKDTLKCECKSIGDMSKAMGKVLKNSQDCQVALGMEEVPKMPEKINQQK